MRLTLQLPEFLVCLQRIDISTFVVVNCIMRSEFKCFLLIVSFLSISYMQLHFDCVLDMALFGMLLPLPYSQNCRPNNQFHCIERYVYAFLSILIYKHYLIRFTCVILMINSLNGFLHSSFYLRFSLSLCFC